MKLDNKSYQKELINEYLEYLEKIKGYSKYTIISYKTDIQKYFDYINENNAKYYDIENYIQNLSKNKYAKTTINRKIVSIRYGWKNGRKLRN